MFSPVIALELHTGDRYWIELVRDGYAGATPGRSTFRDTADKPITVIMAKTNFNNVDEYIATFDENVRPVLEQLRQVIKQAAPDAQEVISYQMPAFKYLGMLVFFAGYKNHIGFYPTPPGIEAFKKELSAYKGAKGSVQFPIDKPLPVGLIAEIVKFKVKENSASGKVKSRK